MNMNYENMWAIVDAHRKCADELERAVKEITGDRPVPEVTEPKPIDLLDDYDFILQTLIEARDQLWHIADRADHTIRRLDVSRCNVFARRCDVASRKLSRKGEL